MTHNSLYVVARRAVKRYRLRRSSIRAAVHIDDLPAAGLRGAVTMRFQARAHRVHYGTKQSVRILRAARAVFLSEGGARFSARRVAREAKVSLSSVQHFFPTTNALLTAMVEYVVNSYDEAYEARAATFPFNGEARLRDVVDYLVDDLFKPDTRRFFFGWWALSCHNKVVEALLDEAYAYHRNNLAAFIGAARPALAEQRCAEIATQIVALMDGAMLFTAARSNPVPKRSEFANSIKQAVWMLISAEPQKP
jgi:AcrR family transcriptional regulator